ncbi:AAA family ATPase [Phytohabitans kaempferiae]|uniref:AAA family ATPase n=1 Tax=Phytohabitans kaempferiae TaxID=1620943 RepID=A0ABV6MCA7_9ACTN
MIIGLEGVSCVGKTTLARALAERLDAHVVPCYYHAAPDPSLLPPPDSETAEDQLAALTVLLPVETVRREAALAAAGRGQVVILDRTVDTLLAHAHAVGRLHGYDCDAPARALTLAHPIVIPDLTLLLYACDGERARRAARRVSMPRLFYDPTFTRYFTEHFTDPLVPQLVPLGTDAGPDAVADQATAVIRQRCATRMGAVA